MSAFFSPDTVSFSNQMELDSAAKKVQSMVQNYYGTSLFCNGIHLQMYIQVFEKVSVSCTSSWLHNVLYCAMLTILCGLNNREANLLCKFQSTLTYMALCFVLSTTPLIMLHTVESVSRDNLDTP